MLLLQVFDCVRVGGISKVDGRCHQVYDVPRLPLKLFLPRDPRIQARLHLARSLRLDASVVGIHPIIDPTEVLLRAPVVAE